VTRSITALEIDRSNALDWVKRSLAQGFDISTAVSAAVPFESGRFRVFAPEDFHADDPDFAVGGVTTTGQSIDGLSNYLESLIGTGGKCVVIEDEGWRPTDLAIVESTQLSAFIGDRVIHWSDLKSGASDVAAKAISRGASGYPLNAFVSSKSIAELGLVDRQPVPTGLPREVANSLLAVVVAAFDAETFLVWDQA
jgi:hypothetical protein